MATDELRQRIIRIEAMLRDRGWHEPDCPIRITQKRNEEGRMFHYSTLPCSCWLKDPV